MIIRQNNFQGGRSDSENSGLQNSFWEGKCLNIHERPGIVTPNYKLTKESGTIVTDFIKTVVQGSNGNTYFFGDTGSIYNRSASSGVYNKAYTDTGNDPILGAEEFNGYMYWATWNKLHRKPFPGIGNWSDVTEDWQTFGETDKKYHPMKVNGLYLFIGDGRQVASVSDTGTFTANGTPDVTFNSLPHGDRIRCLFNYDIDVLMGTCRSASSLDNKARVFRWDTVSAGYESYDEINEDGTRAFIPLDNGVLAVCGSAGNFYFYDGKYLREPVAKKLRGVYTDSDFIEINPGAVSNLRGLALFGVSRSAGDPCMIGVYSLGRYDKNYPLAMNLEYVISQDKTADIEIGIVHALGNDLLVSWKDGTTYGVDKLDYTARYGSAYLITRAQDTNRLSPKRYRKCVASWLQSPGASSMTLKYIKNKGTATAFTNNRTATDEQQIIAEQNINAGVFQVQVEFHPDGRSATDLEEIAVYYNPKPKGSR